MKCTNCDKSRKTLTACIVVGFDVPVKSNLCDYCLAAAEASDEVAVLKCTQFLRCDNLAVTIIKHPIITTGVPTCPRCYDKLQFTKEEEAV